MSATEDFVARCLAAAAEDRASSAVKEVIEQGVRDERLGEELSDEPGIRVLHCTEDLTVAHVVIPRRRVGAPPPVPHDHRMWAVIGLLHGSERNEFFRRSDQTIVSSGERVLGEGDVLAMGRETVHAVMNPSVDRGSSALHLYGGDLMNVARSMWCEPDWAEQPYDFARVTGG